MSTRVNHLDNEKCRQCTSFAEYMKENKKKWSKEENDTKPEGASAPRSDCPLDKDELGTKSWGLLHTIAAKYPEKPSRQEKSDVKTFFHVFSRLYPCSHCAEGLRDDMRELPIQANSQQELSQWLCELHNRVNLKIGKPVFDCSKVNQRWRDGWLDGSCDS